MREAIQSLADGNKIAFVLISIVLLSILYPFADTGTFPALEMSQTR